MSQVYVGTSGWSYDHWKGVFYPENLSYGKELDYYTQHFNTVEINSTFYHLPKFSTWKGWRVRTPPDFIFSVKGSRFITHILKLDNSRDPLINLITGAKVLGKKLGTVLFQLPEHVEANHDRLAKFVELLPEEIRIALEFRHPTWFHTKTYSILEQAGVSLVITDVPQYPSKFRYTADFVYVRLHGSRRPGGGYTTEELKNWSARIKRWSNRGLDVFFYFNNDNGGHAVKNAMELKELL